MAKLLLIVCALLACGAGPALAQTTPDTPPAARLIKPRPGQAIAHPTERVRHPVDDSCRPLKEQLEFEIQKNASHRRLFQARVAHNAGTRLCREGHSEKGIAEFQRGLSYLQDVPH
jgi:hypothetical protein